MCILTMFQNLVFGEKDTLNPLNSYTKFDNPNDKDYPIRIIF